MSVVKQTSVKLVYWDCNLTETNSDFGLFIRKVLMQLFLWTLIYDCSSEPFSKRVICISIQMYCNLYFYSRRIPKFPIDNRNCLNLSWRRFVSYRNQSIDLPFKSVDLFLYNRDHRHERVKRWSLTIPMQESKNWSLIN